MYIELMGGLTSRLDVMVSIVNSQEYKDGQVKLIWEKSDGIVANFEDLYKTKFNFVKKSDINLSRCTIERGNYSTFIRRFDNDYYLILDYPPFFPSLPEFSLNHEDQTSMFNVFYRSLVPVDDVQDTIDGYSQEMAKYPYIYGVNIRRGVGYNYHLNSCIFSPDELFMSGIEQTIAKKPEAKFLITTDSAYTLERLCINYKKYLIYVKEYRRWPMDGGYTVAGMKRGLIDWYLLSKTNEMIMGKGTGFAQRLAKIYNIPITEVIDTHQSITDYHANVIGDKGAEIF